MAGMLIVGVSMKSSLILTVAVTAAFGSLSEAAGPSFECGKESNAVERAVCADAEFSALDLELAGLYQRALITVGERTPEGIRVLQGQRAWLSDDRDACGTIPESDYRFLQCIGNAYGRRIAELHAVLEEGGSADDESDTAPGTGE